MPTKIECCDPLVLLGTLKTNFIEFSPDERRLSYNYVIEQIKKSDFSSILIEDFSLFHNPNFIQVLRGENPPKLDITLCSPKLSRKNFQGKNELVDNPLQLVLEEVESGYSDPQNGQTC